MAARNPGRSRRFVAAQAAKVLKPLALFGPANLGSASSVSIMDATPGSTITLSSGALPAGMVLNGAARTITGTPTALGDFAFSLSEALGGATGSPKITPLTMKVVAEVISHRLEASEQLTVTPAAGVIVRVRSEDGAVDRAVNAATAFGPYLTAQVLTVAGGATVAKTNAKTGAVAAAFTETAAASGVGRINPGNVGIRMFAGRIGNTKALASGGSNGRTFEVVATTAVPFDAIRVVLAFGQTAGNDAITPTIWCSAKAIPDITDASIATDTGWTIVNFGGPNGLGGAFNPTMPPAASAARRNLVVSDIMPVPSVPRTDGGTFPALAMRCYVFTAGAAGNYVIQGDGAQSFANWENHPSGRIWRMRGKGGQFSNTSQSGMTYANSAVENGSPIVGIVYYARGKVVNVAGFGDSITEGQGTYIGEGWGFPACHALSQAGSGIAYEWSNMGWSGQNTVAIRQNVIDAVTTPGLKWDIGFLPNGSPNDVGGTIAASDIVNARSRSAQSLAVMKSAGIEPIQWTWLPTNTAVRNYGASDDRRVGLNGDTTGSTNAGNITADFSSALSGVTTGSQVQILAGATNDSIHPNDTGNGILSPIAQRAISAVFIPPKGRLLAAA